MEMHYGNTWSQSVFGMDHWRSQSGLTSGAAGRYAHVTSDKVLSHRERPVKIPISQQQCLKGR